MPIHQISRFRFVNGYLVEEEDGLTLVDTLLPRSEGRVLAAAASARRGGCWPPPPRSGSRSGGSR